MARRKPAKGTPSSKGYRDAKRQVVELHRQVARRRKRDARKWARSVVGDFDQIAAENFRAAWTSPNAPMPAKPAAVKPKDKNAAAVMVDRAGLVPLAQRA